MIRAKYTTIASSVQLSIIGTDSSSKQCPGIYPAQLVGGRRPQAPSASAQLRPMHKPPVAFAGLSILGREGAPGGPPLGERTTAAGSTTARLRVVSKCALREGRQRERSAQVIPGHSHFGSLLLVNHRPSSLYHSATNEPQSTYSSGLVKPPFIHYIPEADFRGLRKKERLYQYPAFYR